MKIGSFNMNLSSAYMNLRQREINVRVKDEQLINPDLSNINENEDGMTHGVESVRNSSKFLSNSIEFQKEVLSKSLGQLVQFRQSYSKDSAVSIDINSYQKQEDEGMLAINRHEFNYDDKYKSADTVALNMKGVLSSEDGKEISFDINLNMSKNFIADNKLDLEIRDPLVINFEAPTVALSDEKFSFDIDNDGEIDQISKLKSGSGFLALDKNNDGKINDGSELFGTNSGNGFRDLDIYDEDKNGWIDENDSIFNSLRVWKKTETQDELVALGEVGVGAIYLGYTDSPFEIQSEKDTNTLGVIKNTGVFVKDNGDVGTMQNVYLAKQSNEETVGEVLDDIYGAIDDYIDQAGGTSVYEYNRNYKSQESNYQSMSVTTDTSTRVKESGYVNIIEEEMSAKYTKTVSKDKFGNMSIDTTNVEEVVTNDNGDIKQDTQKENTKEKKQVVTADKELVEKSETLDKMKEDVAKITEDKVDGENVISQIEEDSNKNSLFETQKNQKIEEIKSKQSKIENEVNRLKTLKSGISIQDNYIEIQIAKANKEIQTLKLEQTAIETQNFLAFTK